MLRFQFLFISLVSFFLCSCSATGPRYSEIPEVNLSGKSEIIIFRESKFVASVSKYCINIDGKTIGVLSNGGFLRVVVEHGSHLISIPSIIRKSPPTELQIETTENGKTYLLHSIDLASMFVIPIGNFTAISSSWDKKLAEMPEEYWLANSAKFREAKNTDVCDI